MLDEQKLTTLRKGQFAMLARCLMLTKGHSNTGPAIARDLDAPPHVRAIMKSAVTSMGLADPNSDSVSDYRFLVEGFTASLAEIGVFDAMLPNMLPGELHSKFALLTGRAVAHDHAEGVAKPLTRMTATSGTLEVQQVAGLVVMSADMLRFKGANQLVERALETAVATATDANFLAGIASTAISITSMGEAAMLDDIRRAMLAIPSDKSARWHLAVGTDTAKRMSLAETTTGARRFPEMTPAGGYVAGIRTTPTEALTNTALVVDASGLVGVSETIELRSSGNAALEMSDEPTMTAEPSSAQSKSNLVSMFQTNSVALRAERRFGYEAIRPCVVEIDDVFWLMEGSPLA